MAFNPNKTDREAIRAKMTQALRDNDAEAYAAASMELSSSIAEELREQYDARFDELRQDMDSRILAARGVRQLTSAEHDFYQKMLKALAEDMDKTREFLLKDYKKSLEQNDWYWTVLNRYYDNKLDYTKDYEPMITAITSDDVKALAARLLDDKNMIKVVMRPEK